MLNDLKELLADWRLLSAAAGALFLILCAWAAARLKKRAARAEEDSRKMLGEIRKALEERDETRRREMEEQREISARDAEAVRRELQVMAADIQNLQQGQIDAVRGQIRAAALEQEERLDQAYARFSEKLDSVEEGLRLIQDSKESMLPAVNALGLSLDSGFRQLQEAQREAFSELGRTLEAHLREPEAGGVPLGLSERAAAVASGLDEAGALLSREGRGEDPALRAAAEQIEKSRAEFARLRQSLSDYELALSRVNSRLRHAERDLSGVRKAAPCAEGRTPLLKDAEDGSGDAGKARDRWD